MTEGGFPKDKNNLDKLIKDNNKHVNSIQDKQLAEAMRFSYKMNFVDPFLW